MRQDIDSSFANVTSEQEFNTDDIIEALEKSYQSYMAALEHDVASLKEAFDNCQTVHETNYDVKATVHDVVNALHAAKSLKEAGHDKITLNPGKSMWPQVIVKAADAGCYKNGAKFMVSHYKEQLKK